MTWASRWLLVVLTVAAIQAAAEQPSRFYVGAGGGAAHSIDYCGPYFDTVVLNCDNTTVAYKAFGGVQLLDFLAVEAGYANLGKLTSDLSVLGVPVSNETKISGPLLEAVGELRLFDGFSVLAKAGGIYWSIDQDFVIGGTPVSQSDSGVDMVLGLGAQYDFNRHFGVRVEYEYFPNLGSASTTGDTDLNFYSVSVLFRF